VTSIKLHPGDNRESMRRLIDQGVKVHSVVTDPPYGLVSIQKRFGKEGSKAARTDKNDGSFARLSGGFMGKAWDGSGIERDPEFWKLVYDILLPGGYVFAFSGSRTGHWQACAMEMAGFIMHPIHGWCFGSGFPKAHAADKAIDKHLGVEREVVGTRDPRSMYDGRDRQSVAINTHWRGAEGRDDVRDLSKQTVSVPGSPEAAEWEGWAYGTQAQKPALEPIYLGQKPFSEKTGAANLLKHGVGAVNIDGCRVPAPDGVPQFNKRSEPSENSYGDGLNGSNRTGEIDTATGRHPANLLLDGSPEVVAMFPPTAGARAPVKGTEPSSAIKNTYNARERVEGAFHGDSGSAARFFHQFPRHACDRCQDVGVISFGGSMSEDPWQDSCPDCEGWAAWRPETQPLIYNAKAGKADRAGSKHPTVKPIALMQYLVRHITPPGGTVLDPFAGSGTTAEAAQREGFDCILMEAEPDYLEFLHQRFGEKIVQESSQLGLHSQHVGIDTYFDDILGVSDEKADDEFADILG
jgi:DNA modification methylase